jgi:hypothetical protein
MKVGDLVVWKGAPHTAKPMLVADVKCTDWLVKLWNPKAPASLWHPVESLEVIHESR